MAKLKGIYTNLTKLVATTGNLTILLAISGFAKHFFKIDEGRLT